MVVNIIPSANLISELKYLFRFVYAIKTYKFTLSNAHIQFDDYSN